MSASGLVNQQTPPSPSDDRFWRYVFIGLLVLACASLWIFRYIPTQDGPSHLHNATVFANYGSGVYDKYYEIYSFRPAGNMLTQFLLAGLVKIAGVNMAEKLLLTVYVILFFTSFRYFLSALTPYANFFGCSAGLLVFNWFFYMGFWNFIFSIGLFLFFGGYYLRQKGSWTARSLSILTLAGLAIYLTHAVSWIICLAAAAILGASHVVSMVVHGAGDRRTLQPALLQYFASLGVLLPPGVLMLVYMAGAREAAVCLADHPSLRQRLYPLYSLSFLHTIGDSDLLVAKAVAAVLFCWLLFSLAGIYWTRHYRWSTSGLLVLGLLCAVLAVQGPDCIGSGSFIRPRAALYAWIFFIAWLTANFQPWPRSPLNLIAATFTGLAMLTFATRFSVLSSWDKNLSQFASLAERMPAGATILHLRLDPVKSSIDPYLHAVGLMSGRAIIDIRNYEASTNYFQTRFKPDVSPYPLLGTQEQMMATPPIFDVKRYENETKGRVGYLLFQDTILPAAGGAEAALYAAQLANFTFVSSAMDGHLRLYRHNPLP